MIALRSLVFVAAFYLWSLVCGLVMIPLLLAPDRRPMLRVMAFWAAGMMTFLRWICDVRVEIRGREHLADGAALIAAKHQCMFDTMAPMTLFSDACFVMKKELLAIPFYGAFCVKAGQIVIDREAQAKALRGMIVAAKQAARERRQVIIFPEGHRMAPGETGDYKPGVAALYRGLDLPCIPMATNSGAHWPAHGLLRRPGVIVYEFLALIPPGLSRADFMTELETRLEAASTALLGE